MSMEQQDKNSHCYCGSPLQDIGVSPFGQTLYHCNSCGYSRSVRLAEDDSRILHEGEHPSASQGEDGERFPSLIGKIRQKCADFRAREAFPMANSERALDFGCGQGFYMTALKHSGFNPTGIEISVATAERAMGAGHRVFTALQDVDSDPFHALVSIHVMEHIDEPDQVLGQVVTHLQPGARFLIEVPNTRSWQGRLFGEKWLHRETALHVHHFSSKSLRSLLERNGLHVDHESHYSFEHGLLGWVQSIYNVVFPYNRFFRNIVLNNSWQARLQAWPEVLLFPIALTLGGVAFMAEAMTGNGAVIRVNGSLKESVKSA